MIRTLMVGTAICALAVPAIAISFSDRPPRAHTGGFGEPTCQQCHFDSPPNDPAGKLQLGGIPERYTPGGDYTITVSLARPELARGGFQLTARIADGPDAGRQAGSFGQVDQRVNLADTTLARYGRIQYARHSKDPEPPQDSVRWVLKWTAPANRAGAVVFNAAANAANNDDSPLGDYIYIASDTTRRSR